MGISILSALAILIGLSLVAEGFSYAVGGDPNLGYYNAQNGLIALVNGWGLWKGKSWSWTLLLIILVVGLISTPFGLATLQVAGTTFTVASKVATILPIYYLTRKHIKAFFGKTSIRDEFF